MLLIPQTIIVWEMWIYVRIHNVLYSKCVSRILVYSWYIKWNHLFKRCRQCFQSRGTDNRLMKAWKTKEGSGGKLCIKHFQNTSELGALEAPSSCISLDTPFKIYGQFRYFMIWWGIKWWWWRWWGWSVNKSKVVIR